LLAGIIYFFYMRLPEDELAALKSASLLRHIPDVDSSLKNFSSNDYLGLSQHPEIKQAYHEAIEKYGAGSTASRLICGTMEPHTNLEETIATAKGTEAALTFSTGYATSVGTITSLLGKGDVVILDKLCHASLIDGARMSGATLRVFPHNHLEKLESLLQLSTTKADANSRILVITESIFSMDGDAAPLEEISRLTKQYGCLLMVDEAHALGLIGPTGMGLAEELGIQDQIDFQMGTLGKAAGVAGGYLATSRVWAELMINRARAFIYSTAPPPAQAAAAAQALRIIQNEQGQELRTVLWKNIDTFRAASDTTRHYPSAIIPWIVGDSDKALQLSTQLRDKGFLVPAIRYPTVPRHTARLRITMSSCHDTESIQALASCLQQKCS
jgi:8-amino-7-oxononanoate synthase